MASKCPNCGNPYSGSPCPYCNAKRTVPTSPDHIADATQKVQPAPAQLPEDVAWELRELSAYASQNPGTPLAHIYDRIASHITAQAQRLAEANTEILRQHKAICLIDTELGDKIQIWRNRAEAAEARVRELEATIDTMAEAHAHDDMALTAAYLNGAHAGKKEAEAFKAPRNGVGAGAVRVLPAHGQTKNVRCVLDVYRPR